MRYGIAGLVMAGALSAPVIAQAGEAGPYASVGGGVNFLQDSDNDGALTAPFTTGAGTTIPAGTVLPSGTSLGWTTEFDVGFLVNGAVGYRFDSGIRLEAEVAFRRNEVDLHRGLALGGAVIDSEDAGVLITGSGNLGTSVSAVLADGQGDLDSIAVMANGFYDVDTGSAVTPYVGAGIGAAFTSVDFAPSGIAVIDDTQTAFAYQAMAGLNIEVASGIELYSGYRFFGTTGADYDVTLVPGELDVQNNSHGIEGGIRIAL